MSILIDKMYKESNTVSRYTASPYYYHTIDDKFIMGTAVQLKTDTPYTQYTVNSLDTYDSLALKFYNNPTLYWIICYFNSVNDPFEKPKTGSTLKIPSISTIEFDLQGRA